MSTDMFSSFFQDKPTGAAPYDPSALGPTPGTPSIYASAEEWAAFRGQQAALEALTAEASMGSGRGGQGGPTAMQLEAMLFPNTAGAGRGSVNPANVVPDSSTSPTSSIAPVSSDLLKSDGTRDIYGVNAAEGGNRVNKNTAEFGVKATQDASGRVTLTNVGVPEGTYLKPGGAGSPSMPNVSNDMFSAIASLKGTNDPDVARGFLSNIRESAAQRMASIQTEAMNFASAKLGVPVLESQLREAEAADRADPMWYAGIGDSPITQKIRSALLVTRGSVDNEAKNYLAGNTSFASMGAALKTAEEEARRIEKLADRKANREDNASIRAAAKDDQQMEEATAIKASFSPEEQRRLHVLNPAIAQEKDEKGVLLGFAAAAKRADKNPAMRDALAATDNDLPVLAMQDNPHATVLTIAKEQELNPSARKEEIEATLMIIARNADSPSFVAKAVNKKFGPDKANSDEAKALKNDLSVSSVGLGESGKKLQKAQKYALALDLYRAEATDRFLGDTGSWRVNDSEFAEAQAEAVKVTGKADMSSVLTAYMKAGNPKEGLLRLNTFRMIAMSAASMNTKSLFGTPDTVLLDATIAGAARQAKVFEGLLGNRMDSPFTMN